MVLPENGSFTTLRWRLDLANVSNLVCKPSYSLVNLPISGLHLYADLTYHYTSADVSSKMKHCVLILLSEMQCYRVCCICGLCPNAKLLCCSSCILLMDLHPSTTEAMLHAFNCSFFLKKALS